MWFEMTPHGMRKITDDEILDRADQIKARREAAGAVLRLCDLPRMSHSIPPTHSHMIGGCHVCCYRCPR